MNKPTSGLLRVNSDQLRLSSGTMRALAHPLRIKIVAFIDDRQSASVHEIYGRLNLEQSIVSQHLRILRQADLVNTRRDGKFVYYGLNYDRIREAGRIAGGFAALLDSILPEEDEI